MSEPDYQQRKAAQGLPGNRRGRPQGYAEPVTIVSISLDPSTLRLIDKAALKSNRTRSAFVRGVLLMHIAEQDSRDPDTGNTYSATWSTEEADPTRGGTFNPAWITSPPWQCPHCIEERDGALNAGGTVICPLPSCRKARPESTYPQDLIDAARDRAGVD